MDRPRGSQMASSLLANRVPRRRFLAGLAGAGLVAAACGRASRGQSGSGRPSRAALRTIVEENQLSGDSGWQITRPALIGEIAGYCGQVSVQRGEALDLYVSTMESGTKYEALIYRMGWYGGVGGRNVRTIENVDGENQGRWDPLRGVEDCPTGTLDPATLLFECNWKRSLVIQIPDDWLSGYYLVKLHELKTDTSSYAVFVVRDDPSTAPIVVQASTNTWQAYNVWGDASLYGSFGADRRYVPKTRRGYRVSYDRPYDVNINNAMQLGAGELLRWEYNFVRWAESMGFNLTYTTDVDVHVRGDVIQRNRLFISLGHDEYWTRQQRDAVEAARDAGVNVAFFGGNECYWQSRLEPSSLGRADRVLTVYKDGALDPLARDDPKNATVLFADAPVSRPQSMLSGVAYGSNTQPDYLPWRPAHTDSWIFDGTGIRDGDSFPGIVGYEYDHMAPGAQRPDGLTVVGSSPVNGFLGSDTSISSLYTAASGAMVFAAGTVAWSWGLDDYGHEQNGAFADPRLKKLTENIITRLSEPRSVPVPR